MNLLKQKKTVIVSIKVLVTFALIYWLSRGVEFDELSSSLSSIEGYWVLVALSLQFLALGAGMLRWWILCNYAISQKIPFSKCAGAYFLGVFFNQFLPTSVGGDAVRTYAIYKEGFPGKGLIGAGLFDRFIGLFSLIGIASISLYFQTSFPLPEGAKKIFGILALLLLSGLALIMTKLGRKFLERALGLIGQAKFVSVIREIIITSASFGKAPRIVLTSLALSLVLQFSVIFAYMSLGEGLSINNSILDYTVAISIVYVVSSLPISLGGLGLREGTFVALFVMVGVDKAIATNISLLYLLVLWVGSLPGVFVFFRQRRLISAKKASASTVS